MEGSVTACHATSVLSGILGMHQALAGAGGSERLLLNPATHQYLPSLDPGIRTVSGTDVFIDSSIASGDLQPCDDDSQEDALHLVRSVHPVSPLLAGARYHRFAEPS